MPDGPPDSLRQGLRQRHLGMIALGGMIGAGLFVGSGSVIRQVGPGAFLSYAAAGILVILVMRMLGEMATAAPATGSFVTYAREALGDWAGFTTAWLYWYFWVIVVGFEAVAGAGLLQAWLPGLPLWSLSLGLMLLMTATNLTSVGAFGEFEYWFAGIKVLAILAFLVLGGSYALGLWPGHPMDFSNLRRGGSLFPNGVGAIVSGIVVVIFSMVGAEIATIAAAETPNPAKAIARATRTVAIRIAVFYVAAILLLTVILPWDGLPPGGSPFVAAFERMGFNRAGDAMNAVVLAAVLSCLNSGLYTASRMLFLLGERGEAPKALMRLDRSGVPAPAILVSTAMGYLAVVAAYLSPDTVFLFLLNSSGAVILLVYLAIAVSQLILRPRIPADRPVVRMWLYPYLTLLTIAAMTGILVAMGLQAETRSQLLLSLLSTGIVLSAYGVRRHLGAKLETAA
ncbi:MULTISPECIES: amino acid permease [Methylobacterium]|uniref:GABA permease n=1 Tax=Methylobacterium thuringiense TaxID=1003091 RepID=A0ABQ4TR55_9HYPH|nr:MULTISPECIES: amino acid permease [Methylobacterium]TXN22656.1 amino acid permease [Methylobacterium sp. WL9]GJE57096.1 GABA permease [Methylobacterium thuringiense]